MAAGSRSQEYVANISTLERQLGERIPKLAWCFIEPDVYD